MESFNESHYIDGHCHAFAISLMNHILLLVAEAERYCFAGIQVCNEYSDDYSMSEDDELPEEEEFIAHVGVLDKQTGKFYDVTGPQTFEDAVQERNQSFHDGSYMVHATAYGVQFKDVDEMLRECEFSDPVILEGDEQKFPKWWNQFK